MASASFRDSMNSLGWSRRDPDIPVNTAPSSSSSFASRLQSLNPFSNGGYVRLPTTNEGPGAPLPAPTRREEEEGFFALSRWDRLLVFGGCNLASAICFVLCVFMWPVLVLKPSKFAILWTMGSLFFLASWAILLGPMTYVRHLLSGPRLPFTAVYFGSIFFTLFSAVYLKVTILTIISACIQLAALAYYTISYFPMGQSGLRLVTGFATNRATAWVTG